MRALLPCGSSYCLVRMVGTIMHVDSLLNRLMSNKTWSTKLYAAHNKDFSEILWPEKFPRERLLSIRSDFISQDDLTGYCQEYLNDPVDESIQEFKRDWFRRMEKRDYRADHTFYAAADLAITKTTRADYTAIMVVGVTEAGELHVMLVVNKKMDPLEVVQKILEIHQTYRPIMFGLEGGNIEKSILPFLNAESIRTRRFPNIRIMPNLQDKTAKSKGWQAVMKSGAVKWDFDAEWFPDCLDQHLKFPRDKHDDMVDTGGMIGRMLEDTAVPGDDPQEDEEEFTEEAVGRSPVCGY